MSTATLPQRKSSRNALTALAIAVSVAIVVAVAVVAFNVESTNKTTPPPPVATPATLQILTPAGYVRDPNTHQLMAVPDTHAVLSVPQGVVSDPPSPAASASKSAPASAGDYMAAHPSKHGLQ
jgi:hypothetical protein